MPQTLTRWRRIVLRDLALLVPSIAITAVVTFGYATARAAPSWLLSRPLEAIIALGALLGLILSGYAAWRFQEQRREMRRRITAERALHELAFHDPLTQLPNRRQFETTLAQTMRDARPEGPGHALLLLDLNGFKTINDVYGHSMGDAVLSVVGRRLCRATREGDLVARLGGDEFAVLAYGADGDDAVALAERIAGHLAEPFFIRDVLHHVGTGIGIAVCSGEGATPEEIMRRADVALYQAKAERMTAIRCYDAQMDAELRSRRELEMAVRRAVETDSVRVVFQPIVDLTTTRLVGFEALARWHEPVLGDVPPERLFAAAGEAYVVRHLTARVVRLACEAARAWPASLTLAINLSPVQLRDARIAEDIISAFEAAGLAMGRLDVEITESAILHDLDATRLVLDLLRAAGARLVLDDFGTGYSSLHHLRRLRPDTIKIDQSFVSQMPQESESRAIVAAMCTLAHGLEITTTAEGIESEDQRQILLACECDLGQGYLFGRPLDKAEASARAWSALSSRA